MPLMMVAFAASLGTLVYYLLYLKDYRCDDSLRSHLMGCGDFVSHSRLHGHPIRAYKSNWDCKLQNQGLRFGQSIVERRCGKGVEFGCQRSSLSTEHKTAGYNGSYRGCVRSWLLHMCTSSRAPESEHRVHRSRKENCLPEYWRGSCIRKQPLCAL